VRFNCSWVRTYARCGTVAEMVLNEGEGKDRKGVEEGHVRGVVGVKKVIKNVKNEIRN
jgi:hypothetical protein